MNKLSVSVCEFRRECSRTIVEKGFIINENSLIIDMQGKLVSTIVYDYQVFQHHGCLVLKD